MPENRASFTESGVAMSQNGAVRTATAPRAEAKAPTSPRAAVGSVGVAVPPTVVPNSVIAERLGVDDDWIFERTGIRERRTLAGGERLCDLAAEAGRRSLERAGVDAADLDLVLVATTSSDELLPTTAPLVADALGAGRPAAMDVNAACTGFVSALALGGGQIESGRARHVLVIGADALHSFLDPDDKRTAGLFGDGAGAVLMSPAAEGGLGPVLLHSDGGHGGMIYATRDEQMLRMQGHDTFKHAVDRMSEVTLETLAAADLEIADIDLFVYHQANGRILRAVGERLDLPSGRVLDYMALHGNTSAASIPLALGAAESDGRLEDGARLLVASFGAGLVWGGAVLQWGPNGC